MPRANTETRFDLNKAAEHLSAAIRYRTVSYPDYLEVDYTQYDAFLAFLTEAYPKIHRVCEKIIINNYSPVFRWPGSNKKGLKPPGRIFYKTSPVG
jgi:carboxypeptidase PM20D1